jgi:hypothetical protein
MFKANVNQKSISHIRDSIKALELPEYTGTAVLTRVVNDNGQAILTNGKLTTIEPYLFIKSASLTSAQQQSVIDVVKDAPTAQSVEKIEEPKQIAQEEIARLESTVTPRRLRDAIASDEGKAWVAAVELKIKTERDKL